MIWNLLASLELEMREPRFGKSPLTERLGDFDAVNARTAGQVTSTNEHYISPLAAAFGRPQNA